MKLLYLSEANLRNRLFVQQFVFGRKKSGPSLLLFDPFGPDLADTRFVTRRLSSLLSEAGVVNGAFSAEQRELFHFDTEGRMHADAMRIGQLFETLQMLVIAPVIRQNGEPQLADPLLMAAAARETLPIGSVEVFVQNPLSPLAQRRSEIHNEQDAAALHSVYDEESAAISIALRLQPAILTGPAFDGD